jgi:hypothetical protein
MTTEIRTNPGPAPIGTGPGCFWSVLPTGIRRNCEFGIRRLGMPRCGWRVATKDGTNHYSNSGSQSLPCCEKSGAIMCAPALTRRVRFSTFKPGLRISSLATPERPRPRAGPYPHAIQYHPMQTDQPLMHQRRCAVRQQIIQNLRVGPESKANCDFFTGSQDRLWRLGG